MSEKKECMKSHLYKQSRKRILLQPLWYLYLCLTAKEKKGFNTGQQLSKMCPTLSQEKKKKKYIITDKYAAANTRASKAKYMKTV